MARNEATLRFRGDDTNLLRSFDRVGTEADQMAEDIDRAARDSASSISRLETDANAGLGRLNSGVEGSVGKFRGFKDTIDGTTDIAEGFATGDVSMILGGFADLADGVSSVILPKVKDLADAFGTKLKEGADAATAAIKKVGSSETLAGLTTLGLTVGGILATVEAVDYALEQLLDLPGDATTSPTEIIGDFLEAPEWLGLPDWTKGTLKTVRDLLPFHTGGIVGGHAGQTIPAVLQAGEQVIPRGQAGALGGINIYVGGSVISERDLGRVVADALRNNRLTGVN